MYVLHGYHDPLWPEIVTKLSSKVFLNNGLFLVIKGQRHTFFLYHKSSFKKDKNSHGEIFDPIFINQNSLRLPVELRIIFWQDK